MAGPFGHGRAGQAPRGPDARAAAPTDRTVPDNDQTRRFVVGLGNPGQEYAGTRHNVGFGVLEVLRRCWDADAGRRAFGGRVYDARPQRPGLGSRRVLLLEPHTFMNCSGRAVREMAQFYQASPPEVLVVLDDMALPAGCLRMRADGSPGGHNGLADVLAALGSEAVPRLRIGIGSPAPAMDPRDFVLGRFRAEEMDEIERAVRSAAQAVEDWVFHGTTYVMDRYNRSPDSPGA